LGIFIKLIAEEFDLVEDAISVNLILFSEKISAMIVESIKIIIRPWLNNITLFTKAATNIVVNVSKPLSKFLIVVSVTINLIQGVEEILRAGSISKSFEDSLKVRQCGFRFAVEV
jgi:hypothetical protein